MFLTLGVVLSASTVLLFAWGFAQHRRARPAGWTRVGGLASGFAILIVMLIPTAMSFLTLAALHPADTLASLSLWGAGAMAVSVALAWWLTPGLILEGRSGGSSTVHVLPVSPGGAPVKPPGRVKRAA